jgi:hypothetical protein
MLDAARKRWRAKIGVLYISFGLAAVGIVYQIPELIVLTVVFGALGYLVAALLDRIRRTVRLDYELDEHSEAAYQRLVAAFMSLGKCRGLWRIPMESSVTDWKRNAGATSEVSRSDLALRLGRPSTVKSKITFPRCSFGRLDLFFAPDCVLVVGKNSVAALAYTDMTVTASVTRFIEHGRFPSDAMIVGQTWQYVSKRGGPDRRFKNNRQLPVCLYGQLDFTSGGGLNERIEMLASRVRGRIRCLG